MNETAANSTSPSPTPPTAMGAVADSSGKLAAAAATTTSVKLLIKASNQQFDDQIIESDLLWTVKRLKTQLALVYPSKPPVAEQKLIYSGQLLNDTLLLKDVIRSYKDVYTQNHIFHLVYTPKQALNGSLIQKPSNKQSSSGNAAAGAIVPDMHTNTSSSDGLRQRHVGGGTAPPQQGQHQQLQNHAQQQQHQLPAYTQSQYNPQLLANCPQYNPSNPLQTLPFSFPGQFNMQAMATQQVAMYNWMQQVYSQYMDQCIRMSNTTAAAGLANISTTPHVTTNAAGADSFNAAAAVLPTNPFLQLHRMPCNGPHAVPVGVATAGATTPVIQFPSATATAATLLTGPQPPQVSVAQTQATVAVAGTTSTAVDGTATAPAVAEQPNQPQQPAPQRQQVEAPRFPNIVQEEQENRDWLDSFFSITRLAIFLTILYFNSSPLRCLGVFIIAGVIYLYHIGVLRFRPERNNNNINRNNNAAAEADQIRQGVREVQQAAEAAAQQAQGNEATSAAAVEGAPNSGEEDGADGINNTNNTNNNSTSVISVLRTFVVTFFTSLLPETPTL